MQNSYKCLVFVAVWSSRGLLNTPFIMRVDWSGDPDEALVCWNQLKVTKWEMYPWRYTIHLLPAERKYKRFRYFVHHASLQQEQPGIESRPACRGCSSRLVWYLAEVYYNNFFTPWNSTSFSRLVWYLAEVYFNNFFTPWNSTSFRFSGSPFQHSHAAATSGINTHRTVDSNG